LSLALLALTGCGPVYRIDHRDVPPASAAGQYCVSRCATERAFCRSEVLAFAQDDYRRCQLQANADYNDCRHRAGNDGARAQCRRDDCYPSPDYDRCDRRYGACFRSCGGVMETRRVCVANCRY
jgi:hypothetical protein